MYYHYAYDAVGNRLTQETALDTTNYVYDVANDLTSVNGVSYTWDNNCNLLNDGVNTYAYDSANRLKTLTSPSVITNYTYRCNGDLSTIGGTPDLAGVSFLEDDQMDPMARSSYT